MQGNITAFGLLVWSTCWCLFPLATAYCIFDNVNAIKLQFMVLTQRVVWLAYPARFTDAKLALATKWSSALSTAWDGTFPLNGSCLQVTEIWLSYIYIYIVFH